MFVELVIGVGAVALGALALRALRNKQKAVLDRAEPESQEADDGAERRARDTAGDGEGTGDRRSPGDDGPRDEDGPHGHGGRPRGPLRGGPRGLRVDDVLLYADDELWLSGEIYLDEEGFALSLFRAPGSPRAAWVAMLDPEGREVAFLDPSDEVPDGALPTELPVGGIRLSLRRRGHADVRSEGTQLPLTTERAGYAILGGPGGRTLVVVDFEGGDRIALAGERLGREMYDLPPGGDAS